MDEGKKMTKFEVASLCYKLAGIYVITQVVLLFPILSTIMEISRIAERTVGVPATLAWAAAFVLLLLSTFLLTKSTYLATRTFSSSESTESNTTSVEVRAIAFSILGVTLISFALPELALLLTDFLLRNPIVLPIDWSAIPSEVRAKLISEILQVAFGALLLAYGSNFAALWQKPRGRHERVE
jgi:hypothetical protein